MRLALNLALTVLNIDDENCEMLATGNSGRDGEYQDRQWLISLLLEIYAPMVLAL